jgi:hypothetical protein
MPKVVAPAGAKAASPDAPAESADSSIPAFEGENGGGPGGSA